MTKINHKILSLFVLCSLLSSINAYAQNEEGKSGTVYSSYGSGFPLQNNTAQEKGMGIMGVSFNDLGSPGLANPAFWGIGIYSRVAANFDFTSYSLKDSQVSGSNSLLKVGSFQAVFPISKNRLGMSIALYPETRSSYNVNSLQTLEIGNNSSEYFTNRTGTGGATKFEVGLGAKINKNFSIGYAPSYSFLTERENETVFFTDGGSSVNNVTERTNGTSVSHRFGLLFNAKNLFKNNDALQIGATLTLPTTFDAKRKAETVKEVGDDVEIVQIGNEMSGEVSLPLKMGGGVSYFLNRKFNASIEFQLEKWDEARYEFSSSEEAAFKNKNTYGFGFQYHPYKSNSSKFLSKFKYSAGISYDTGHLQIRNTDIETLWFSAGLGLISPTFRSSSSFDLSFQYGLRGSVSNDLVKENIFGINLSVNLTELMFLRRKLN
ncbi:MAG: hypothetical protein ROO71_11825 [Balneola sp.]